ncbi:MAG: lysophospholipid acyltransferase family protein [Planctomycetota bacterium]
MDSGGAGTGIGEAGTADVGAGQRWRWRLEYAAARAVISLVQLLTPRQCAALANGLAWLLADVLKVRRRVTEENLTAVFPAANPEQIRSATRQMWYHLVMMGCEVVLAPRKIHSTNWRKYVTIRDKRLMTGYLIDYRPLVAVSGHYGNFEMAGYATGLLGFASHTVARKLDNPYLDRYINEFRATNGQFILPKDGSATAVQKVLDDGGIIAILGDQHAGTKGCWVDFLGRPAACHKAVALFTLESEAPMMVSYCRHTDRPFHFEVGCTGIVDPHDMPDELRDVKSLTQWYNDRMAQAIAIAPAQYWWLHRRWKEKPVRQTKKLRQAG